MGGFVQGRQIVTGTEAWLKKVLGTQWEVTTRLMRADRQVLVG